MTTGKWIITAAGIVLFSMGASSWIYFHRAKPAPKAAAPEPSRDEIVLSGVVTPRNPLAVPAPVAGIVESIEVTPGGDVLAEQILGKIRDEELSDQSADVDEQLNQARQTLEEAEARLTAARLESSRASADATRSQGDFESARAKADRQELLYKEGATPRNTYEAARRSLADNQAEYTALKKLADLSAEQVQRITAEVETATNVVEELTREVDDTAGGLRAGEVVSPIDGVLVSAAAQPGEKIDTNSNALFVVAPSKLNLGLLLQPEPKLLAQIREGMPALVTFENFPDTPFPAIVARVSAPDVEIHFDTTEAIWIPGQSASVRIKIR
jgi:multidrug resistance efflux pump